MGWFFSSSSFDTSRSMKCFNNELYGVCGGCVYMNPRNYNSGLFSGYSYKCTKRGSYYPWRDRACRSVEYVDPERIDCCERYKEFSGRKYFILTAIFEILGISLDNRMYEEIKILIDLVRSDESTTRESIGYDIFGQEIADKLRHDPDNVYLCYQLMENYIIKIYTAINLNEHAEAIKIYENMVIYLFNRYNNMENFSEMLQINRFEKNKVKIK